jgi:hypothetical protein
VAAEKQAKNFFYLFSTRKKLLSRRHTQSKRFHTFFFISSALAEKKLFVYLSLYFRSLFFVLARSLFCAPLGLYHVRVFDRCRLGILESDRRKRDEKKR